MASKKPHRLETMILLNELQQVLGSCRHQPGKGWRFYPTDRSSHKPSRKFYPDPIESIPVWALEQGDELMTLTEYEEEHGLTAVPNEPQEKKRRKLKIRGLPEELRRA